MSIGAYTDLVAALVRRLHRTDLAADIPDFIQLAEKRISTMLRTRLQETAGTITTVAGAPTAALPTTLLGIQSLSIAGVMPTIDYLTPEGFNQQGYRDTGLTGAPREYTTIGSLIYFGPIPDAAYTVACTYRGEITPLTAAAPTNDLLTKWPNVYLYGALAESVEVTRDTENGTRYEARFRDAIDGVNLIDWHAGGAMRVRSDVRM